MTIHIACMMPDRALEDSAIARSITSIAIELAGLREHPVQKRVPVLDLAFLLPSRQEKADFDGLRLHSFDAASQTLRIESAIHEKMMTSSHAERFLIAVMLDAVDAAAEFFIEQLILFDAAGHLALIESLTNKKQYAMN